MRTWAALALALGGCAEPYELVIGEGFSEQERAIVEDSANQWLSVGCVPGRVEVRRAATAEGIAGSAYGRLVRVRTDLAGQELHVTLLHELGHVCGIAAHHRGPGVMTESYTRQPPCLTRLDVAMRPWGKGGTTCPDP